MGILHQVVTASEWAKICNVTPQYIRRLCGEGKLDARQTEEGVWLIIRESGERRMKEAAAIEYKPERVLQYLSLETPETLSRHGRSGWCSQLCSWAGLPQIGTTKQKVERLMKWKEQYKEVSK